MPKSEEVDGIVCLYIWVSEWFGGFSLYLAFVFIYCTIILNLNPVIWNIKGTLHTSIPRLSVQGGFRKIFCYRHLRGSNTVDMIVVTFVIRPFLSNWMLPYSLYDWKLFSWLQLSFSYTEFAVLNKTFYATSLENLLYGIHEPFFPLELWTCCGKIWVCFLHHLFVTSVCAVDWLFLKYS